jgi:hypothetical protein
LILSSNQSIDVPIRKSFGASKIDCRPDKSNSICIWNGTGRGGGELVSGGQ